MKRGRPPRRTKGLRSSSVLRRGTWTRTSTAMGRARLKPVSARRRRQLEDPERRRVREAVFARDSYRCVLNGVERAGCCWGHLTPHHVRKEGQGGAYTEDNLVTMCCHHNDEIEADADLAALARELGYVKKRGD